MSFSRYLKSASILSLLGGVGFLGYEIHSTYNKLNSALDTNIIDITEPKPETTTGNRKYVQFKSPDKSVSFIDRFWDTITFAYARRLLHIAQSEDSDRKIRLRAVKALSNISSLDNWHYSLLAHMCDAKTAVGLARSTNINLKYFLDPPNRYVYYNHDKLVSWMKHFFIALNKSSDHPCIAYFLQKAFVNPQDVGRMIEHDLSSIEVKQSIKTADDILPLCVESILHHSSVNNFARDIVLHNGLPLLMEIHKKYKNNDEITIALAKILANISLYPELLQDIYRSGWIGVLAKWMQHENIRIRGPAAKALVNLDVDENTHGKFDRKIYLLYPIKRTDLSKDVDVILVHGLLGGVFFTWRQRDRCNTPTGFLGKKKKDETISCSSDTHSGYKTSDQSTKEYLQEVEERKQLEWCEIGKDFEMVFDDCPRNCVESGPYSCPGEEICSIYDRGSTQCWPMDWLPEDIPYLRIIGINYDTNLSHWAPVCPIDQKKNTLDDRSGEFLEKLTNAGVGDRPIIWLTHSMGGLLVKNMLVKAENSSNEKMRKLCDNTKGIVFYSTPHKGSQAATLNQTASLFIWPSVEVRELREGCPTLIKLHNNFLHFLEKTKIRVLSFVETEFTTVTPLKIQFHFVPTYSAKMNYGEYYEIPLDHLRICKPINRHSFLYRKVVLLIKEILEESRSTI